MVYLRDLNKELQREFTVEIMKARRLDLIKAIHDGDDIQIGEFWKTKDFEVA